MISERCELVKLCHINRSSPVFLRHSVVHCPNSSIWFLNKSPDYYSIIDV